ncbi:MAG: amidohydrolase family protein [SAR202 cluster bacterium]|nr:amidohydrolase family protein [SAR202 cluster bacterium]|tara:strand:+ start:26518 stop:27825 length:1308 start_codon:yes stop_codon:yes gene_type:complete
MAKLETGSKFKIILSNNIIDGISDGPIKSDAILVEDSKIVGLGNRDEIKPPIGADAEIYDFSDSTVMPGMVDAHTHHNGFGDGRLGDELVKLPDEMLVLNSARNARKSLFSGVTTIRENGPKNKTMLELRKSILRGDQIGPRMMLCGRPISIIGGHMSYFGSQVTGEVQSRAMVRQLVKEGSDYIKITATGGSTITSDPLRPAFNLNELKAITEEAHKFNKLTAAHCTSTAGIKLSVEANVDMIIHSVFKDPNGENRFDNKIAELMVDKGVYINPTLHVFRSQIWAMQKNMIDKPENKQDILALDKAKKEFDIRVEDLNKLIDLGAKVITGSDSSWGDYQLGNTVYEVECLELAGLSRSKSLKSVTKESAVSIGVDESVGTLAKGKDADILVLGKNPYDHLDNLWKVRDVFLRGSIVDRGSTDSLSRIRQIPPRN